MLKVEFEFSVTRLLRDTHYYSRFTVQEYGIQNTEEI